MVWAMFLARHPAHAEASNGGSDKNSSHTSASPGRPEASMRGSYENSSHGSVSSSTEADDSKDGDYKPEGLVFSDDEGCLIDVDSDSEDERLRSSFPKDKRRKKRVRSLL